MNRQLLSFAIWVLAVLFLLAIFTLFQDPGPRPAPTPAPQEGAQSLVALLISWLPFFFLVGVWMLLAWWMRRGAAPAPTAAMLDDPAYWRGRADAARALSERLADLQSKRQMLEIVRGYEYLAQRAEERRRGPDTPA
jgi:uncharacterized RDD family membrane protein YckC